MSSGLVSVLVSIVDQNASCLLKSGVTSAEWSADSVKLGGCFNDLCSNIAAGLLLLLDSRGDFVGGPLENALHFCLQVRALLVDPLNDLKAFLYNVKVALLLERPFCHLENKLDFLLVVQHVLHVLELGLKQVQLVVEHLSLVSDAMRTFSAATRGLRDLIGRRRRNLGLLHVDFVELVDGVMHLHKRVVDVRDVVRRVPRAHYSLAVVQLTLQLHVLFMLLRDKVVFELLDGLWVLVHVEAQLDLVVDHGVLGKLRLQL